MIYKYKFSLIMYTRFKITRTHLNLEQIISIKLDTNRYNIIFRKNLEVCARRRIYFSWVYICLCNRSINLWIERDMRLIMHHELNCNLQKVQLGIRRFNQHNKYGVQLEISSKRGSILATIDGMSLMASSRKNTPPLNKLHMIFQTHASKLTSPL